ncbi:MAG: DUF2000 family protein [Chloroflexota bacterium]
MEFSTKIAIVVADDLASWQKMNVVAFLTSGVISKTEGIMGEPYVDGSGKTYHSLCIQPIVVLKASREKLPTFLARAERREVPAAIYIEDMFVTGHDAANRETVTRYASEDLPLVGIAIRAERKEVDKIFKGAKLHD